MDTLLSYLRYGLRTLAKSPGFAFTAILTLALGIGASTAIFSVVEAVLLRALPYPDSHKIVRVWEQAPDGHRMIIAGPNFDDFRTQNHTFANLAAFGSFLSSVSGGREPVRVNVALVSPAFFDVFRVAPWQGQVFRENAQNAPAAVVSYGYWQRYLGASPDLSKLHVAMEGKIYPIAGVMPPGFDFPSGVAVWIPREHDPATSRTGHNWNAVGRVRDDATVAQARADLSTIARRIKSQYGKDADLDAASVVPLAEAMVGDVRTALLTVLAAAGLLLLVTCANVGGLFLARTSARQKELAVRRALGASRGRLIGLFLAESFLLSLAGGAMGVLTAISAVRLLRAILPANLPRQEGIGVDLPAVLFALAATVAVAISLGLFASWRATQGELQEELSASSRGYSGSGATHRLRSLLVAAQIAVTLMILVATGLLGRSFLRLVSISPGFNPKRLITMEFSPPHAEDPEATVRQIHRMDEMLTRLRAIPGTESVGLSGAMPVANGDNLANGDFLILHGEKPPTSFDQWDRFERDPTRVGNALYAVASEEYFRTLGIPLIRGRMFGEQDGWNSPHVAVISETLARQRWTGQDPIGQEIDFGNMDGNLKPLTIVGVAGDVLAQGLNSLPSPIIYVDYRQRGFNSNSTPTILMRSSAQPGEILPAARGIFRDLVPDVPVKFSTFTDEMSGWLADRRFLFLLVGAFAISALALAAIGIYGVVAFSVGRRTPEFGIRMALGAQRKDVLRLVLRDGTRIAALGVAIGLACSLAITRLMGSLLFGVSPSDPLTFAVVAFVLTSVALLAAYFPARRATRVDPMVALRHE
ncbi:MAG: ABC transporter permease [Acidobacteriaceae bacterium]